jgi:hypothetical protein
MDSPDLKLLKSLADTCRKAGITAFKGFGYEFSLDLSAYRPRKARSTETTEESDDTQVGPSWDELSDDEKMFYSSSGFITPGGPSAE